MLKKRALATLTVMVMLLSLWFIYFVSAEETTTATQPTATTVENENNTSGTEITTTNTTTTTNTDWVTATGPDGNTLHAPPPVITTTTTTTAFITTAPTRRVTTMVHNPARPNDNLRPPPGRSPVPNFWLMSDTEFLGYNCCDDADCMMYCCCDDPECFFHCCCDDPDCQHHCIEIDNDLANCPLYYVQEEDDPFWEEVTGDEPEIGDQDDFELTPRPGPNMLHVILVGAALLLAGVAVAAMLVRNKHKQVDEYFEESETY